MITKLSICNSAMSTSPNMTRTVLSYLAVGILWGCTNPFIKYAQNAAANKNKLLASSNNSPDSSKISYKESEGVFSSIFNMFKEPTILIPFAINQLGSLAFYYVLIHEPISIAAPVCNSLTFILTAITGHFVLGEEIPSPGLLLLGIAAVISGIYICITSS